MRRLLLAAFLFMAGSGMLLTGALTSVASAAPAAVTDAGPTATATKPMVTATATPTGMPTVTATATPTVKATTPVTATPTATKPMVTASPTVPVTRTPTVMPTTPVMPVGPVGTGGGGSLGGGVNEALAVAGALLILAAAGLGVLTWRRSRGAHLS